MLQRLPELRATVYDCAWVCVLLCSSCMTVCGLQGGFSYSGQRCTAVKVVLAMEQIADELVKKVNEGVKDLSVGMPEVCNHADACKVSRIGTV